MEEIDLQKARLERNQFQIDWLVSIAFEPLGYFDEHARFAFD